MKSYDRILRLISETPLAIHQPKIEEIVGVIEARMNGVDLSADRWEAIRQERERHLGVKGGVAVVGLHGTIAQRVGLMDGSGGTSAEKFGEMLTSAVKDPDIAAIVVDVDSPGGSVYGIPELAAKIRGLRGQKPMIAVANAEAFSAAYWIASQFDQVVITPSGMVGSVGVVSAHVDQTAMDESLGIKVTYIHAGKYKVEGNSHEPLSDEAHAEFQRLVDRYYSMFVADLAKGRGVSVEDVRKNFGEGRTVLAADAVKARMADRVATLEQVIEEQSRAAARKSQRRAMSAKIMRSNLDMMAHDQ